MTRRPAMGLLFLVLGACSTPHMVGEKEPVQLAMDAGVELPDCCRVPLLAGLDRVEGGDEVRWGVRLESVRMSGAGNLLDVRLRVLDAERAAPLFDRRVAAHLVHTSSGLQGSVPVPGKIGPLRQTVTGGAPREGRVYFLLFGNPGGEVRSGDDVTLEIGPYHSAPLRVL